MHKKTIILGILVIIWMGFIFYMSSDTGEDSGSKSHDIVNYIITKYDSITNASEERVLYHKSSEFMDRANLIFRKTCHFMEFCILGILLINFFISMHHFKLINNTLYSFVITVIYAILDEYHQTFVNGRSGEFNDVLIDTFGGIFGIILITIIYIKTKNNFKK